MKRWRVKKNNEYGKFERTMRSLLRVTRHELETKLNAEKVAKKRKKARQSSASGRASSGRV